jgi:hypothetical protein
MAPTPLEQRIETWPLSRIVDVPNSLSLHLAVESDYVIMGGGVDIVESHLPFRSFNGATRTERS